MKSVPRSTLQCFFVFMLIAVVLCENKYSKEANAKKETIVKPTKLGVDFRTLEKPFRINKLNILWTKAQQRLTEPKLQSLYSDLKIHDKEELTYKRLKNEGGDKEGLMEATLRRKLTHIMTNFGLREHFEDHSGGRQKDHPAHNSALDDHINRSIFKDKKLNMLWAKAEASGFTSEELAALKEEFGHHQEKIDQYYELLNDVDGAKNDGFKNAVNEEELDNFNEINYQLETNEINKKEYIDAANLVRDKHRGLRDGYDRLQRMTARGPNNKEFIEPKVQGLWKIATAANFTVDELESLKVELQHYESRLRKLRHIQADHVAAAGDKMDHFDEQQQMIKKHTRKVQKLHDELEGKILARHSEL
ncbi:alpha-2-macroglobulin receptor-associated protein isoform X2 [Choristoneura fumiferana]|uniref:alpha-2-macroglobulin receptor-associated protein isoform X2 n=1 Tax=Choristoneura fumiferana TaxID=7141 RepID=UPI003D1578EB